MRHPQPTRIASCIALALVAAPSWAQRGSLALPGVPNPLGVNIHFTDARPGEMEMLARGGFKWIRMDFGWHTTEPEKGRYDFTAYDRLMASLETQRIRAIFILDYSNPLYDDNQSPHTDAGRAAMARWAAAATKHFMGRGIVWEMYNEPNIGFWRPKPNVEDYVKVALAVGKAIRAATANEVYAGPATSTIDFSFLETCFKAGLLQYWDAVTVHPYRQNDPETVEEEYRRLRLLIAKFAPKGKAIPIVSGEWGYSAGWNGMDEDKQGRMLARETLVNLANDIPISIWYDWHDDGLDPKEPEHHFGTVHNPYREGVAQAYEPKPAYLAARALAETLRGFRFNKRLWTGSPDDYVLLFSRGKDVRIAAWTRAAQPREVTIPTSPGRFHLTDYLAKAIPDATADSSGLRLRLSVGPVYIAPDGANVVLADVAMWRRLPPEIAAAAPGVVQVQRPSSWKRLSRGVPGSEAIVTTTVGGQTARQRTEIIVLNPLLVTPLTPASGGLPVRIANSAGDRVECELVGRLGRRTVRVPVKMAAGQAETVVTLPVDSADLARESASLGLVEAPTDRERAITPEPFAEPIRIVPMAVSALVVTADGDSKVASEQTIRPSGAPPGLPSPYGSPLAWRIDYRFDAGWKFLEVKPPAASPIGGKPKRFGLWVDGDGSGNVPRLRFTDSSGQTFQPDGEPIKWRGWRWVEFPMDGSRAGHWGGPNDGAIHYPISWDSLFLLDSATRSRTDGTVYLFGPTLFY